MALQGPKFGSTAYTGGGTNVPSWTNPNNVLASDGVKTTVTFTSLLGTTVGGMPWLAISGLNFAIPANATITGVSATVKAQVTGGLLGNVYLNDVFLTKVANTPTGSTKGTNVAFSTTEETRVYGADGDLWGNVLSPADVNSSGFGLAVRCISNELLANRTIAIDSMTITVYYKINSKVNVERAVTSQISTDGTTKMKFVAPSKLTAIADGLDVITWVALPSWAFFSVDIKQDNLDDMFDATIEVTDGMFDATFSAAGAYDFTLSAPGFEDQRTMIHIYPNPVTS